MQGTITGFIIRRGAMLKETVRAMALACIGPSAQTEVLARLCQLTTGETVHATSGRLDLMSVLCPGSTEALDASRERLAETRG
ncbi:hypothetical protein KO516_19435 [Citreicella sp. C3M06]|uniref:hypothetical protein n=1 Tax=Citreicella sp. C3M06 TaxID=2841564 RepID=UPI001C0962A4|nr:hypothetical protein [Citreicella sp. C3M06]MBU2962962.1 hypothetical protein [Citreicella sp. C3M06]